MLDYIHDGICSPMSFLYDNYCAKSVSMQSYGKLMYLSVDADSNTKVAQWELLKTSFGTRAD